MQFYKKQIRKNVLRIYTYEIVTRSSMGQWHEVFPARSMHLCQVIRSWKHCCQIKLTSHSCKQATVILVCETFHLIRLLGSVATHFTKVYVLRIEISWKFHFVLIVIQMIKSSHKFAHVTTAELSWHVQNCVLIWTSFVKQGQHDFFFKIWIICS